MSPIINPSQGQDTKLPPGVGQARQSVRLSAHTVRGSLIQGKGETVIEARLTTTDGRPIKDASIEFLLKGDRTVYGTVDTDPEGYARYPVGAMLADVQGMVIGAVSGYIAHFEGNEYFKEAQAEASVHVGL
ncbi:hypothetical protein [Kitasatospora sp. NPDC101183]|uniref:hypothetical protein n=1 Tax=Kitasatospora sp. NPDC101183 TaxID=3364100 RepID=UPI0038217C5B